MSSSNIFDYMAFPEKDERQAMRDKYKELESLKSIQFNINERYGKKIVPSDFGHYEFVAGTWINEFNHYVFILNIPLLQLIKVKESLDNVENEDEKAIYTLFFGYYSEIVANFVNMAFQKSLYIYNVLFQLEVNNGKNDIAQICKVIRKNESNNIYIKRVNDKLNELNKNKYYKELRMIRNDNTHNVGITRNGFIDVYEGNGLIMGTITKSKPYDQVFAVIMNSIRLLNEYAGFSESLIYEYCDFRFDEFTKFLEKKK